MAKKLIHVRKGSLRLTPTGKVRRRRPSLRIGGRLGVNVSSKGAHVTLHRGRGSWLKRSGCGKAAATGLLLLMVLAVGFYVKTARPS